MRRRLYRFLAWWRAQREAREIQRELAQTDLRDLPAKWRQAKKAYDLAPPEEQARRRTIIIKILIAQAVGLIAAAWSVLA